MFINTCALSEVKGMVIIMNIIKCIGTFSLTVALLFSTSLASFAGVAPAFTTIQKSLNITSCVQEQSNWCWAATTQCTAKFIKGTNPSQTSIVTGIFGSPAPNSTVTLAQDNTSLVNCGLHATTYPASVSFSTIVGNIDSNRPMKSGILWTDGGGHFLTIYGYWTDQTSYTVSYMNPANGGFNTVSYDYLVSNPAYHWSVTEYNCY